MQMLANHTDTNTHIHARTHTHTPLLPFIPCLNSLDTDFLKKHNFKCYRSTAIENDNRNAQIGMHLSTNEKTIWHIQMPKMSKIKLRNLLHKDGLRILQDSLGKWGETLKIFQEFSNATRQRINNNVKSILWNKKQL